MLKRVGEMINHREPWKNILTPEKGTGIVTIKVAVRTVFAIIGTCPVVWY